MHNSASPKRNKFIPSFPMRSKHFIKRYEYKRSSILEAIEHFKQQLSKLDYKTKKSPALTREPQKSSKSINFIDLTLSFNQNTANITQHSILSNHPMKASLPPLKPVKKPETKEFEDLVCYSKRPAFGLHESSRKKTMNISKSHKIKQMMPDSSKLMTENQGRKKILISNNRLFNSSSDSSESLVMDPTLG